MLITIGKTSRISLLYRRCNGSVSVPTYDVSAGGGGGGAHGESDYPYTLIEGDDLLPEIIVGRISVRSVLSLQQLYKNYWL